MSCRVMCDVYLPSHCILRGQYLAGRLRASGSRRTVNWWPYGSRQNKNYNSVQSNFSNVLTWLVMLPSSMCIESTLLTLFHQVSWASRSNRSPKYHKLRWVAFASPSPRSVRSSYYFKFLLKKRFFWEVVVLERGPLSLVRIIEELLEWKSSGFRLENRD
jgi:hypothetical protein